MTATTYAADRTALLIVDPYNDFMSEGGKLFNAIRETADASGMFGNLRKIIPRFAWRKYRFLSCLTVVRTHTISTTGSILICFRKRTCR